MGVLASFPLWQAQARDDGTGTCLVDADVVTVERVNLLGWVVAATTTRKVSTANRRSHREFMSPAASPSDQRSCVGRKDALTLLCLYATRTSASQKEKEVSNVSETRRVVHMTRDTCFPRSAFFLFPSMCRGESTRCFPFRAATPARRLPPWRAADPVTAPTGTGPPPPPACAGVRARGVVVRGHVAQPWTYASVLRREGRPVPATASGGSVDSNRTRAGGQARRGRR